MFKMRYIILQTFTPEEPDNYAFRGMESFVRNNLKIGCLQHEMISRSDYLEQGSYRCNKKFYNSW